MRPLTGRRPCIPTMYSGPMQRTESMPTMPRARPDPVELPSRRTFIAVASGAAASQSCTGPEADGNAEEPPKPAVIDFHQHTNYNGRKDEALVAHQRAMGVDLTVLLPAGSRLGRHTGLDRNESVQALAERFPDEFVWFANEFPDSPETHSVLDRCLRAGARGIGEQKFEVACDSAEMQVVYSIAREFDVPVLLHFQHERYNTGIERFHTMLARFPEVVFIGHAQTWWGNIDALHEQSAMYPKTPVEAGGITDRLLSDYPNIYGDLSAGSGLNSMLRDEDHARGFLERHQDRLIWASDCNDSDGAGDGCTGSRGQAAVRRLAPSTEASAKILSGNAARLLKLG